MLHHVCLVIMLLIYAYAIYSVYTNYTESNTSISSILKQENCNDCVMNSMVLMGIFTLIYEFIREDLISFVSILFLLIGIYGLLMFDDTTWLHNMFTLTQTQILYREIYLLSTFCVFYLALHFMPRKSAFEM